MIHETDAGYRDVDTAPIFRRYGRAFVEWGRQDFQTWFALHKNWPPTETARTPIGTLVRIIDAADQQAQARERERKKQEAKAAMRGGRR